MPPGPPADSTVEHSSRDTPLGPAAFTGRAALGVCVNPGAVNPGAANPGAASPGLTQAPFLRGVLFRLLGQRLHGHLEASYVRHTHAHPAADMQQVHDGYLWSRAGNT